MSTARIISIGNFDGVHRGHQAILARAADLARPRALPVAAITFEPHPATVLRPQRVPPRIMSFDQRVAALKAAGADEVLTLEPTPQLLASEPGDFVRQLVQTYQPTAIVEGENFRFGRNRAGDMALLRDMGRTLGFEAEAVAPVTLAFSDLLVAPVSSTHIRWLLGRGRVFDAAMAMNRWFEIQSAVVTGDKRGRTLGFPTINLDMAPLEQRQLPAEGVYAGLAILPDGARHAAAISVGRKPTFEQSQPAIEAYLLNYSGDLYGQTIRLQFCRWLRDQHRFPSLDTLSEQLHRDVAATAQFDADRSLETLPQPAPVAPAGPHPVESHP